MPLKKKVKSEQQVKEENQEESSSSSFDDDSMSGDESEDDEFDPNEEIMIDFEARNILESDLESVKIMLQQKLVQFQSINLNELAKIVVQQENIGNAIYQALENDQDDEDGLKEETDVNEDDTIFGVLSLIDLNSTKTKTFSTGFIQWLKQQAESHDKINSTKISESLNNLLNNKNISYVVNERYINIPPGISVPMFESLLKDLDNLSDESPNKKSDYWLFLSKIFSEENAKPKSSKLNAENELIFANPEEEVFEEFSELKFEISYGAKSSKASSGKWSKDDPTLNPSLRLFLVSKEKISDALNKVKTLIK